MNVFRSSMQINRSKINVKKKSLGIQAACRFGGKTKQKNKNRKAVGSSEAVKVKQLNSPVTMSPAGAGSGNGDGPRETAGRSN